MKKICYTLQIDTLYFRTYTLYHVYDLVFVIYHWFTQGVAIVVEPSGMITGNVSGPCMQGFYYVTALPRTNLFLLVIENWKNVQQSNFFNFNCRITQK